MNLPIYESSGIKPLGFRVPRRHPTASDRFSIGGLIVNVDGDTFTLG